MQNNTSSQRGQRIGTAVHTCSASLTLLFWKVNDFRTHLWNTWFPVYPILLKCIYLKAGDTEKTAWWGERKRKEILCSPFLSPDMHNSSKKYKQAVSPGLSCGWKEFSLLSHHFCFKLCINRKAGMRSESQVLNAGTWVLVTGILTIRPNIHPLNFLNK